MDTKHTPGESRYVAASKARQAAAIKDLQCRESDGPQECLQHACHTVGWVGATLYHKTAIDNHDALLAALEGLVQHESIINPRTMRAEYLFETARAAIAAAKGEA